MNFNQILSITESYYSEKIKTHGPTAKGVDWNSHESQMLRFAQLLKVCDTTDAFSINDYGCGYGALVTHMHEHGYAFQYCGFDISEEMLTKARQIHANQDGVTFVADEAKLPMADYTVASGIFNVKQRIDDEEWQAYVLHTLGRLADFSSRGFAFNILTGYADRDRMRPDLYYADPLFLFDYCKKNFSRFVSLLHDYRLYEFTILVKK